MPISYVRENLFDSPAQTIVNAVNTVGVMGRGVALQFKERYPEMFARYVEHCRSGALQIGKLWLYRTPSKWVLNFPTKKHWRHPSKIEWIDAGLGRFVETYAEQNITSVAFPMLGCGNGGLDWSEVGPVMERHLGSLKISVFIHLSLPRSDSPEHLNKRELARLRAETMAQHLDASFGEFWDDLAAATGLKNTRPAPLMMEGDPEPLPLVPVREGKGIVQLPGEDFARLWFLLAARRALKGQEFPGALAEHSKAVADLLVRFDGYIKPIHFTNPDQAGIMLRQRAVRVSGEVHAVG